MQWRIGQPHPATELHITLCSRADARSGVSSMSRLPALQPEKLHRAEDCRKEQNDSAFGSCGSHRAMAVTAAIDLLLMQRMARGEVSRCPAEEIFRSTSALSASTTLKKTAGLKLNSRATSTSGNCSMRTLLALTAAL